MSEESRQRFLTIKNSLIRSLEIFQPFIDAREARARAEARDAVEIATQHFRAVVDEYKDVINYLFEYQDGYRLTLLDIVLLLKEEYTQQQTMVAFLERLEAIIRSRGGHTKNEIPKRTRRGAITYRTANRIQVSAQNLNVAATAWRTRAAKPPLPPRRGRKTRRNR